MKKYMCILFILIFFCSHVISFFLMEALYPLRSKAKLETHETIFVTTLGNDTNENKKNSLAPRQLTCVQIPRRGMGKVYLWLSHWKRWAHSHGKALILRLKMACGGVGGWEQKKDIVSVFDILIHLQQLSLYRFDLGLFSFELNSASICGVLAVCNSGHFKKKD